MDDRGENSNQAKQHFDELTQPLKDLEQRISDKRSSTEELIQTLKKEKAELTRIETYHNQLYTNRATSPNALTAARAQRVILFKKQEACKILTQKIKTAKDELAHLRHQRKAMQASLLDKAAFAGYAQLAAVESGALKASLKEAVGSTYTRLQELKKKSEEKNAQAVKQKRTIEQMIVAIKEQIQLFDAALAEEVDENRALKRADEERQVQALGDPEKARNVVIKAKINDDRVAAEEIATHVLKNKKDELTTLTQRLDELDNPEPSEALKAAHDEFDFAVNLLSLAEGEELSFESNTHRKLSALVVQIHEKEAECEPYKKEIERLQDELDAYQKKHPLPQQREEAQSSNTKLLEAFYTIEVDDEKPQSDYEKQRNDMHVKLKALDERVQRLQTRKDKNYAWWERLRAFCVHTFLNRLTDLEQSEEDQKHTQAIFDKVDAIYKQSIPLLKLQEDIATLNAEVEKRMTEQPQHEDAAKELLAKMQDYASRDTTSVFSSDAKAREKARRDVVEQTREATHEILEQGRATVAQVDKAAREMASKGMNLLRQGIFGSKAEEQKKEPEKSAPQAKIPEASPEKIRQKEVRRAVTIVAQSLAQFLEKPTQVNLYLLTNTAAEHPAYQEDKAFGAYVQQARDTYQVLADTLPRPKAPAQNTAAQTTAMREQVKQEREGDQVLDEDEKKPINRGRYGGRD